MATKYLKSYCLVCNDEQDTYECQGCLTTFCFHHLTDHREMIKQEFVLIEDDFNSLRQKLHDQKENPTKYSLIKQINQWENDAIYKIKQTAQKCRDQINKYLIKIENQFDELTEQTKEIRKQNKINEMNSKQIKEKLNKLNQEFEKRKNISIEQKSSTIFIHQIFVRFEASEKRILFDILSNKIKYFVLFCFFSPFRSTMETTRSDNCWKQSTRNSAFFSFGHLYR